MLGGLVCRRICVWSGIGWCMMDGGGRRYGSSDGIAWLHAYMWECICR